MATPMNAGDQADAERQQRAGGDYREEVAALPVAAEGQCPGRRLQHARRKRPGVLRIHQQPTDQREGDQAEEQGKSHRKRLVAAQIAETGDARFGDGAARLRHRAGISLLRGPAHVSPPIDDTGVEERIDQIEDECRQPDRDDQDEDDSLYQEIVGAPDRLKEQVPMPG